MVDEVAQLEDAELEALLSLLEGSSDQSATRSSEDASTPYGNDDEEYDHIFIDVIQNEKSDTTLDLEDLKGSDDVMDLS